MRLSVSISPRNFYNSLKSIKEMHIVTDIGKYLTVAAKQIILKERFIKKPVVYIGIIESRLFMEEVSDREPTIHWTKLSVFTF